MPFVHLRVHSCYSLLDSTIRIEALTARVKAQGMDAVALTDHSNLFGAVQFKKACRRNGVKPIYGAELQIRDPRRPDHRCRLVVLARDEKGFANLSALVSRAHLDSPRGRAPSLPRDVLATHAKGLIGFSGGLAGEIQQALLAGDEAAALESVEFHLRTFGESNFYLDLMSNDTPQQREVNVALVSLSSRTGVPLVATADAHYLEPADALAHAVLVAMGRKQKLSDELRRQLLSGTSHLATPEEMATRFADHPEALEATRCIADRVDDDAFRPADRLHVPVLKTPAVEPAEHLVDLARQGLEKRLGQVHGQDQEPDGTGYRERLENELRIITGLGFDEYFLVVAEYVQWARENGVPVGPGRGSGAGSLVAWAIGITDVDPVLFGLLFERFLNPERVSPPDFDIDFCMQKRDQVLQHVVEKYGKDRVAGIVTFASLRGRPLIRKVASALGMDSSQAARVAKMVPQSVFVDLEQARAGEPELAHLISSDPTIGQLWTVATTLERLPCAADKHAAGLVIADRPIADYVPLCLSPDGFQITQFDMKDIDTVGLVKFDFLGLTALTVVQAAVDAIRAGGQASFCVEDVPFDDAATFRLLSDGDTTGIFQLEGRGITDLLKRVQPDRFEDLPAIVALFRPGPLGAHLDDAFLALKNSGKPAAGPFPQLEPILRDSRGLMLFQEQLMRIAIEIAGYAPGDADLLRRAMGKKDATALKAQRKVFVQGEVARTMDTKAAGRLFDWLAGMADHLFNQSHAVAYAMITWRMAWLKTHHPEAFMQALESVERA